MAVKKRGLGRGLDALLSGMNQAAEAEQGQAGVQVQPGQTVSADLQAPAGVTELSVNLLQRGKYQPRRDLDPQALEELAESIRQQGVIQPILVRPLADDRTRYEIIAGERRWRASQMAELTHVPVVIREVEDDAAIAMALIENIQREDLNPVEEAVALKRLQDEFALTQQQVAQAVGKSRSAVANLLRLLQLEESVKKRLEHGDLEMGHARALLALSGGLQESTAQDVVARELTVRQTESLVKQLQTPQAEAPVSAKPQNPHLSRMADELTERFKAPVKITGNAQGRGKITIAFDSEENLNQILQNLR